MPTIWDKSPNGEVSDETKEELNGKPQDEIDYKLAHKEAADALSIKAEELIKTNIQLATLNPKFILEMDKKMQNKVVKEIYWYNSIEEVKLLLWDNFYEKKEDKGEEEDVTAKLAKEVRLLKYQSEQGEMNRALETFALKNPEILKTTPDAIAKIKTELEFISDKLSHTERIDRASKVLFGNYGSPTKSAYLDLQDKSNSAGGSSAANMEMKQSHKDLDDIFDARISANKQKEAYLAKMRGK